MVDMRYRIEEDEDWIIVCVRDPGLAWGGQHWVNRDGSRPVSFRDRVEAELYAREVFASSSE
jgi:hypothetical protein